MFIYHKPLQVGACIVNSDKRVVGIGYNSMPYIKKSDDNKEHHNDKVFPWKGKEDETFNDTRYDFERKHLYGKFFPLSTILYYL